MAIEKIALDNVKKVVDNDSVDVDTHIDLGMAAAYEESITAAEHVSEIIDELEEKAAENSVPAPSAPEVKLDNMYTQKHTLDESIEEFRFSDIDGSKDDEDRYVEFDMFDFIFSLFSSETDALTRPIKALSNTKGRGRKKAGDTGSSFMYQGSDDYIDETGEKGVAGVAQISTDTEGNVVLYQDNVSDFDKVIELCDEYGFEYEGPTAKRAPWLRWNYSFKVIVPTYADGYPMEVEDYFEQRGIPMEDVMPAEFISGRKRDYKKMNDEVELEYIYKKHRDAAGSSNDPLEGFLKDMFKELDAKGVKYDRKAIKDRFLAEFEDDFEDDEIEEGFISNAIDGFGDTVSNVVQSIL